jgi:hypothetical protein
VPGSLAVFFVYDKQAEQAEAALELKNKKITRLEVLRHTKRLAYLGICGGADSE